jgi:hypothetical protein
MNKLNKLFAGFAAVAMLAACSNDEPTPAPETPDSDGQKAYMSIRIQAATGMSRSTTDGNFEDGNKDEHAVKNVRFFFFDAQGAAMDLQAYLVGTDGNVTVKPNDPANDNVEAVFGNNILVLEKLTSNNYPNYMITVLNRPGFECGTTLTNTLERLSTFKDDGYYVMSTASYAGENAHHDNTYYHATKLQPTDFKPTAEAAIADKQTVSVYVERLAAKVQVGMAESMTSETKTLDDGTVIYKLDQTVANGTTDNEEQGSNQLGTALWIKVLGWDLNTTVNDSYMCKNIDTEWTFDWDANGSWNASNLFRSYWSKSTIYDMTLTQATAANKLSYVRTMTWKDAATSKTLKDLGNNVFAYCNENTNVPGKIFETEPNDNARALIDSRIVTNVVLYAQICDDKGEKLDDLVMANGVLFRSNSYLQYVINRAYAMTTALNIWEKTSDVTTKPNPDEILNKKEYQQIGTEYFELVFPEKTEDYDGVGDVDVKVKANAFDGKELYKKNEDGSYSLLTDADRAAAITALETAIATVQPQGENHAVMYENGKSVYYIPVQHLGALEGKTTVDECYYGVVRNHWYKLTISKFTKVGHGIWDPEEGRDETLKPDKPENPLYYLGADINILAWKVVNQNVEL